MGKLGVNIDHVATLREARKTVEPDPLKAAMECVASGCDSIVCHLRKDRRHLQDDDLFMLKRELTVPLNMEMSVDVEIVDIACNLKPDMATIVPENRKEITTEGGLDVRGSLEKVKSVVKKLKDSGIEASLFIDPDAGQLEAAISSGAQIVELHTGGYAHKCIEGTDHRSELENIRRMVKKGLDMGLLVSVGHGLTYTNVGPIAEIPGIFEFNIGHSIISKSIYTGIGAAVRLMKELVE